MTKFTKATTIISIIISIFALLSAIFSRRAASKNNDISESMLSIEKDRKLNESKEKSAELLGDFYDKIMYHDWLYEVYDKLSHNKLIWNEKYLYRFIDEFEWIWNRYCNEEIYESDLRIYSWFFAKVCENNKIEQMFSWRKNSLSKMCSDLNFNWMWKYFNWHECNTLKEKKVSYD